jgi:hypothetical protein
MAEHKKEFYLATGEVITSLKGFASALKTMAEDTYNTHVTSEKNDFSAWARHSLGKEKLSQKIDGQISKIELELEILRHLVHEDKKHVKKKTHSAPQKKSTTKKTSKK